MNIFQWLYRTFVYDPQLNLLHFFYNLTGDTGVAIVLIAIVVNLILWPFFAASYINSQKMRLLQPKLKEIQEKYKGNQQEILRHTMEFNKKHKLNSSSIFLTLFAQLFFASGVYFVITDATAGKNLTDHLYPFIANLPKQNFDSLAFGFINIKGSGWQYIWLPLLNSIISFLYGMYSFKWAPQVKLPVKEKKAEKKKNPDDAPAFDPEAIQKSVEFNTVYALPFILFIFNFNFPAGLNIYFTVVSIMSLIRQIFLTNYYASHTEKLLQDIASSDPQSKDNNPSNNLELTADPALLAEAAVPVEFVKKETKNQNQTKKTGKKK